MARKKEMVTEIKKLAKKGYRKFATRTVRCLNTVESPDPDEPAPQGYKNVGFWHDCHKREVDTGDYNDVVLFASKK